MRGRNEGNRSEGAKKVVQLMLPSQDRSETPNVILRALPDGIHKELYVSSMQS